MENRTITVEGLEETMQMLRTAPKNIVALGFLKALDAGSQVFIQELWPRVPIDMVAALNAAHGGKGALITRIDAFIELDPQFRGGVADVGFGDLGHIALWVEYGHRNVRGRKPNQKLIGMVRPHPFMRPAFEAGCEKAVDAFAEALAEVLKQEYRQI